MKVTISPSGISGSLRAPASKSSMQRACAAALISKKTVRISNPGSSSDELAALRVIRSLGADINNEPDGSLLITANGIKPVNGFVNCGESGLGIRMFAPLIALCAETVTIEGEGSLLSRPMDFFDEVLPQLDVEVTSNKGKLPLQLKGPLIPKNIETDGSLSSQFLTGLLFAYAASDAKDVTIRVKNLTSRPYIDLTLSVMEWFQLKTPVNNHYESFYFSPEKSLDTPEEIHYTVEGDWSGGAFLLVAAAIAGRAIVYGLDPHSKQADKAILRAMHLAGVGMHYDDNEIHVHEREFAALKAFHFDATNCPDLFPPLVALAAVCEGSSFITGVSRLAHKESDRAKTLQEEFKKMGVDILLNGDVMGIKGVTTLHAAMVHSREDHRIAMALSVAALRADGPVQIENADAIRKSYPGFFDDLVKLGASVHVLDNKF